MSKSKNIVVEFNESKTAQYVEFEEGVEDGLVESSDDVKQSGIEYFDISDDEEEDGSLLREFKSSTELPDARPDVVEFSEEDELTLEDLVEKNYHPEAPSDLEPELELETQQEPESSARMLPGSDISLAEDEEEKANEVPGTWEDDRDVRDFMRYVEMKLEKSPRHKGELSGVERLWVYLNSLLKEFSPAVALDTDHVLDVDQLDSYRIKIMNDMMTLKKYIKKLQKDIRDRHDKKAEDGETFKVAGADDIEFTKEATAARPQLVITPFERAISGMIVNSVVSAGKPLEDVYAYLKKKYSLTDREELSIMQLVTDMGLPIFKDRGTYGSSPTDADGIDGVDYMKNYFG